MRDQGDEALNELWDFLMPIFAMFAEVGRAAREQGVAAKQLDRDLERDLEEQHKRDGERDLKVVGGQPPVRKQDDQTGA